MEGVELVLRFRILHCIKIGRDDATRGKGGATSAKEHREGNIGLEYKTRCDLYVLSLLHYLEEYTLNLLESISVALLKWHRMLHFNNELVASPGTKLLWNGLAF